MVNDYCYGLFQEEKKEKQKFNLKNFLINAFVKIIYPVVESVYQWCTDVQLGKKTDYEYFWTTPLNRYDQSRKVLEHISSSRFDPTTTPERKKGEQVKVRRRDVYVTRKDLFAPDTEAMKGILIGN